MPVHENNARNVTSLRASSEGSSISLVVIAAHLFKQLQNANCRGFVSGKQDFGGL
jgi:hypothetical protein